ncbi:MAG TPA: hypothetical protein VFS76_21190 [Pyrinomonadaceae bacterium]|nr:hypothetical protein [Pyrinomonadaceae bacterium]
MQFTSNHDNTSRLFIGGLSLLALLGVGVNRVLNVLKGRKEVTVPRYNPSRAMLMSSTGQGGQGTARAPVAKRTPVKKQDAPARYERDSRGRRIITITGVIEIVGRRSDPPALDDDQLVYLDE